MGLGLREIRGGGGQKKNHPVGTVLYPNLLYCSSIVENLSERRCQGPERGLGERGITERGLNERGLAERGLAERGPHERGITERGITERGLTERGLASMQSQDCGPSTSTR